MDTLGVNLLHQWHKTTCENDENGEVYFTKYFTPNSYEVKNELSWLTSILLKDCSTFSPPAVKMASINEGIIKMEYVPQRNTLTLNQRLNLWVQALAELHGLIRSNRPYLRQPVSACEYSSFLQSYIKKRIDTVLAEEFDLPEEIVNWIRMGLAGVSTNSFSIVHRDARLRHQLVREGINGFGKPVIIDWEFSNISDPAQDIAKLIYDVVQHGLPFEEARRAICEQYAYLTGISDQELMSRVRPFLPVIPLERDMSLINRAPTGYSLEVVNDLKYINMLYAQDK